jgi:DNA-binding CsgD family transcriptional regulator
MLAAAADSFAVSSAPGKTAESNMNLASRASWEFVEDARRATSLAELESISARYTRAAGFAHYGFAVRSSCGADSRSATNYMYFHNVPEPWGRHRYEKIYTSSCSAQQDPLMIHLRAGLSATAYSSRGVVSHTRPDIARRSRRVLQQASDHGVRSGIFAPLAASGSSWSFMVMTSADTSDVREILPALPDFLFFAHHVLSAVRVQSGKWLRETVELSARECEILRWCAIGKTSWEIGQILNLAECTINYHLQAAARKLRVSGRRAACAQALMIGAITL